MVNRAALMFTYQQNTDRTQCTLAQYSPSGAMQPQQTYSGKQHNVNRVIPASALSQLPTNLTVCVCVFAN